ncbi:hypothetical protein VHEMI07895 [[Torrubiella] hemipterigena]|uniref:B-(1-6) glucan synthase n=1 Tax=[Torrubiella] hemipterigena TaxID=1531966 RepID=A0A0A1TBV0_9HYPO|nr:hypothetical protein VHEMI07895 [[Torrubiella] hemipterigena]
MIAAAALSLAALALPAAASTIPARDTKCFPYNGAEIPQDLSAPNVTRADWWCPQSMAYGFQGFSYPLENGDCNAYENSVDGMDQDFKRMKEDFGATLIRMYYPGCTQPSVFINAMEAAARNNMGIILQVNTFFGDDKWRQSQQAIYDAVYNPKTNAIAPYVVHSVEFGSEPVGDGMDGENLPNDLGKLRSGLKGFGIPVGISEDWDRPNRMSNGDNSGLGDMGQRVKDNSDVAHIHPMPFYHDWNGQVDNAWGYIKWQTQWVVDHVGLPTMISESPWAWYDGGQGSHSNGHADLGRDQYQRYWKAFDDNCEWFKQVNVGWFIHTFKGEGEFDIVDPNGGYIIPNWKPRKC